MKTAYILHVSKSNSQFSAFILLTMNNIWNTLIIPITLQYISELS